MGICFESRNKQKEEEERKLKEQIEFFKKKYEKEQRKNRKKDDELKYYKEEYEKEKKLKNMKEEEIKKLKKEKKELENQEKIKRKSKKREILERQKKLRKEKEQIPLFEKGNKNEEIIKEILEDMCAMGSIMKKEILEEKISEPEKFIPIEEATKEEKDDGLFCLGVLAKHFENAGITTVIEKKEIIEEESQNEANTILQFISNGMVEKKKFNLHFDFGEQRNNQLLNDKNEQEKFNEKLRQKLSLEYNIPEEKIIITNPQRGSYQIQVLFQTDDFNNDTIDLNDLKNKCKNDKDFQELKYLKEISQSLIMEGCKLNINMLDSEGNRESGWGVGEKRGGLDYFPPLNGWKGYGLKVLDQYDDGNNDWIQMNGNKNEWAVAYHGIGAKNGFTLENATNAIIKGGFKAGDGQAYKEYDDVNHPGNKIGVGVYCSPKPEVMEEYAGYSESTTIINGKKYMMGFMMRVKPDKIRYCEDQPDYWVLDGTTNEMRPYRILIKEIN